MNIVINYNGNIEQMKQDLDKLIDVIKEELLKSIHLMSATIQLNSLIEKVEINTHPCSECNQKQEYF